MRSIKVGEGGTAFMLDANGITIADVDSTLVGVEDSIALGDTNPRLKKYSAICKKMVAGENGTGTYSYGGATKVVAYSPLKDMNGWSIGIAAVRNEEIPRSKHPRPPLPVSCREYRPAIKVRKSHKIRIS